MTVSMAKAPVKLELQMITQFHGILTDSISATEAVGCQSQVNFLLKNAEILDIDVCLLKTKMTLL